MPEDEERRREPIVTLQKFIGFFYYDFLVHNFLISPDQHLSIPLDQNELILLVSNKFDIFKYFGK